MTHTWFIVITVCAGDCIDRTQDDQYLRSYTISQAARKTPHSRIIDWTHSEHTRRPMKLSEYGKIVVLLHDPWRVWPYQSTRLFWLKLSSNEPSCQYDRSLLITRCEVVWGNQSFFIIESHIITDIGLLRQCGFWSSQTVFVWLSCQTVFTWY